MTSAPPDLPCDLTYFSHSYAEARGKFRGACLERDLPVESFPHPELGPEGEPLGPLNRAYAEFQERPSAEWNQIELTDPEIIALVNLKFLSEYVGVTPLRVLRAREDAGGFIGGFARLRRPVHSG